MFHFFQSIIAQTYQTCRHTRNQRLRMVNALNKKKIKSHDIVIFTRDANDIVKNTQSLPELYLNSDFCICPKGDSPMTKSNYDGCIPVYLFDSVELPFSGNISLLFEVFNSSK